VDLGGGLEEVWVPAYCVFKDRKEALQNLETRLIKRAEVGPVSKKNAESLLGEIRAKIASLEG